MNKNIGTYVMIAILLTNVVFQLIIKFNDLSHITLTVTKIVDKVDDLSQRVSKIEGNLGIE